MKNDRALGDGKSVNKKKKNIVGGAWRLISGSKNIKGCILIKFF